MARRRFIIEIGTGVDLHGEDATKAACRAVEDAVSSSCLCGLSEVLDPKEVSKVEVEILIATPRPESVDREQVKAQAPVGDTTVDVVDGGLTVRGLMSPKFGPEKDQILVANAALTVYVS